MEVKFRKKTENFPKLVKNINPRFQEKQWITTMTNKETLI